MGTPSVNFTVAGENFDIPVDETEQTDPTQFLIKALRALENHTHASTRGAAAARLAASVASAGPSTITGGGLTVSTGGITVTAGGLTVTAGGAIANRYKAAGTALVSADIAGSATWGSTSVLSITSGSTDQRGQLSMAANGAGIGANPTLTITFKDGTWTTAPFAVVTVQDSVLTTLSCSIALTATTLTITFCGTPVAGRSYGFNYIVMG